MVCTCSPTINASCFAGRVIEGGHDVPISKIISRYGKSIRNCCISSHIVDRLYIYDNSTDNKNAELLFRTSEGSVTNVYTDKIPHWASIIYEEVTSH